MPLGPPSWLCLSLTAIDAGTTLGTLQQLVTAMELMKKALTCLASSTTSFFNHDVMLEYECVHKTCAARAVHGMKSTAAISILGVGSVVLALDQDIIAVYGEVAGNGLHVRVDDKYPVIQIKLQANTREGRHYCCRGRSH